jgi:hypothetical protein
MQLPFGQQHSINYKKQALDEFWHVDTFLNNINPLSSLYILCFSYLFVFYMLTKKIPPKIN